VRERAIAQVPHNSAGLAQEIPSERSRVSLDLSGDMLKLSVAAEDIVSMRAAVNTWLRLIRISEDMLNTR
jgi:KEOPS complex subunit Pcc1